MQLYRNYKFHNISIIPIKKLYKTQTIKLAAIPIEWKFILMNDGSFTQNLNSLTGKHIKIKKIHKISSILLNEKTMRAVWLKDSKKKQLALARSLWPAELNHHKNPKLKKTKPIGQSIIESKIDIYKDIHEIYYGYSKYLDIKFKSKGPIWGRKYTMYYNEGLSIIMQEFFSPHLINYFKFQI